jgi:hypothetical protein
VAEHDMYLVANISGDPAGADDNGILTAVDPDGGKDRADNWAPQASGESIRGEEDNIQLDAPKGMAVVGSTLYVADITVVRRFEARAAVRPDLLPQTGGRYMPQQPDITIEGATFLNDVADAGDGGVFVSDSGLDATFQPTGTDAVYHVAKNGKVTTRIKDKSLGHPNGVWAGANGSVWVVTFGTGELFQVDANGKKGPATKLPGGKLDGVVVLDGGDLLVSSWEAKTVYRGKPGGEWKEVVSGLDSPADIGYDPKRKRLLVPSFLGNTVTAYPLE